MDSLALKKLSQKQFDGLSNEVQVHFADVSSWEKKAMQKEEQAGVNRLYNFTMVFLTQCAPLFANDKAPLEPEVVRSIEYCCHGYSKLCKLASVDSAKVASNMKVILYIVSKLSGKVNLTTHINLSSYILESLQSVSSPKPNDQLDDLIFKFYTYFWNAAIIFERQGQATPLQVCKLRFLSVRILALRSQPSTVDLCLEKSVLVLGVFEHKSSEKTPSKGKESSCMEQQKDSSSSGKSSTKAGKTSGCKDIKDKPGQGSDCEKSLKGGGSDADLSSQEDRLSVLSLLLTLLDELSQGQPAGTVYVLKLCAAAYDFLAGAQLIDHMSLLKNKLCKGDKAMVTTPTLSAVSHFLDLTRIVELSCGEEEELPEQYRHELADLLSNTVAWVKQLAGCEHMSMESLVEIFHWFLKQLKGRKIRSAFFTASTSTDDKSLAHLLLIMKEVQVCLALVGVTDDGGGSGSGSKEEKDKRGKTHLEAHRICLTLHHKALTQQLQRLKKDARLNEVLSELEEQVNSYTLAINRLTSSDVQLNERYFLGSMCVKFGHLLYNQCLDKESIVYYTTACQQLTLWCMADPKLVDTKLKESSLLKVYNCLSQTQHKVGRLDDAMATTIKSFATCCRNANDVVSTQLITAWVRLKKSAVKDGGEEMETRLARSFGDDPTLDRGILFHCLQVELIWLLSGALRPRMWPVEEALLKRYVKLADQGKVKDIGQILLLQFDILTKASPTKNREETDQCLNTLTARYPDDHCLQAALQLIWFCLQVKAKVELPPVELSDEENLTVDAPVVGNHEKMIGEEGRGLVRTALRHCDLALTQQGMASIEDPAREVQCRMFRDLLMMVADILMVCREFLLQLEVLAVAKSLSRDDLNSDLSMVDIHTSIVDALAALGVDQIPPSLARLFHAMEKNSKEAGLPEKGAELLEKGAGLPDKRMDSLLLSFINLYSKTGQVTEMRPLLDQFRDRCAKTNMSSLLSGKFHRTLGQCLCMAPPDESDSSVDNYMLLSAQQAYRFHFSVFSRASGEEGLCPANQAGEETLWRKLMELLQSTLFLGRVYRQCGDAKRSRVYLKEGLALATKFGLLKWSTLFGLEVAALLSVSEFLQPMVDILKLTYTHFSRIEPSSSKPSALLPGKTSTSTIKILVVTADSLVEEYSIAHAEEQQRIHDKETSQAGFWQRMQVYQKQKLKEAERPGLDQEIADLSACVGSWCQSLVKHPSGCWCQMCNDAECQLLALTLTQMSIKAAHRHSSGFSAEHRLEHFFSRVLKHFRQVNPSNKVTRLMQSAGFDPQSEVNCGDWQYLICLTELSLSLAETGLHCHDVPQALVHISAASLVLKRVPQLSQETVLLQARLIHLHAVCLLHQKSLQQSPLSKKSHDWKDSWCLLTESQLAAQVQSKIQKLHICRVSGKGEKVSHKAGMSGTSDIVVDGGAGSKVPALSSQTSVCGQDRIRKVSPGLATVQASPRVLCSKPGDERNCDSRASLSEEFNMASSLDPFVHSKLSAGSKLAEKKGDDVTRLLQTSSLKNNTKEAQVMSVKSKTTNRKLKQSSSDKCSDEPQQSLPDKESKPKISSSLVTPEFRTPLFNSSSQLTGSVISTNSREAAVKVSASQPASRPKQNLNKKSKPAVLSATASSQLAVSSKEKSDISSVDPVVKNLFPEGSLSQTPLSKLTPATPSSLVKQILGSTKFSDSEDEFKPSTPISTPRPKANPHQQKTPRTGKMPNSRLIKNRKLSNQSAKKTLRKKGEDTVPVDSSEDPVSTALDSARMACKSSKRRLLTTVHTEESTAIQDVKSNETIKKDPYSLDISQDGTSPIQKVENLEKVAISSKCSASSQARSSQSRKSAKKTSEDMENASCRTAPASNRQSLKVLSERNDTNINLMPVETVTKQKDTSSPQLEGKIPEAAPKSKGKQTRKNRAAEKITHSTKQLGDEVFQDEDQLNTREDAEVVLPPAAGNKTKRGGRKPKDCGETASEPPRRNTRASKDKVPSRRRAKVEAMPEIETVRGGGESEKNELPGDIFDFVENDNELHEGPSVKGKKGRQAKTTGVKKVAGKSTQQPSSRTASAKVSEKSKKTAPSKSRLERYAPKPVPCSKSEKSAKAVNCVIQPDDLSLSHCLPIDKSVGKDQTQTPSTVLTGFHADPTSIETLRHVLTPQSALRESCDSCSQADKGTCQCNGKGCKGCGQSGKMSVSAVAQSGGKGTGKAWHLESLLAYFQNQGKGLEGICGMSIAVTTLENTDTALMEIQADLSKSLAQIQHFPNVPVFGETCKVLAQIKLDKDGDPWEIAALLGESAAVTLRHQFLAHCQKQMRLKPSDDGDMQRQTALTRDLEADFQDLLFPWDVDKYRTAVEAIPQGWTVCQFSVVDNPGGCSLMLTRMASDLEPITVNLPRFSDQQGQMIYFEFHSILKSSDETVKIHDKSLWWNNRVALDTKLENLLDGMEKHWLGPWKGLLAGQTSDPGYNKVMTALAVTLSKVIHKVTGQQCSTGKARQILDLMQHTKDLATVLSGVLKQKEMKNNTALLSSVTTEVLKNMPSIETSDLPVIFILDKHLANLPLEQLKVTQDQPITRVPSLALLHHLLKLHGDTSFQGSYSQGNAASKKGCGGSGSTANKSGDNGSRDKRDQSTGDGNGGCRRGATTGESSVGSVAQRGVDPTSVFYVLNPDGDLQHTQSFLKAPFEGFEGWKGVTASVPTTEQYTQALTQHDMFVYSGHGSGCKYFSREEILKIRCRAVLLLFGCSSVHVDLFPDLDPDAYFYSYLLAGSPCVLGNLWDVTDRDMDLFCLHFLNLWLKEEGTQPSLSLASLVQQARSATRMRWLNGSSPVVYGLPVSLVTQKG